MDTYRVAFAFHCAQGHPNLGEYDLQAESLEEAQTRTKKIELPTRCRYCPSETKQQPPVAVQVLGVERKPRYPTYSCLGYVCECSERVAVFRWPINTQMEPAPDLVVSCSRGHKRAINTARDLATLIPWTEEQN